MNYGHFYGGVLTCTFPFCILIFIGWFFSKLGAITYEGSVVLSKLCIEVFLPCYIFIQVCKSTTTDHLEANAAVIVSQLFIMVISVIIAYFFVKIFKVDVRSKWTFISIASISEVKFMNYLVVNTFCYHTETNYTEGEMTYCNNMEEYAYSHMFFQIFISWYFLYLGIRKDREHWRTIVEVGRDIAKAYETELIIDDSSESSEDEEEVNDNNVFNNNKETQENKQNDGEAPIKTEEVNIELADKREENLNKDLQTEQNRIIERNEESKSRKELSKLKKEKSREIKQAKKNEEDKLKKEKQIMYDEYQKNLQIEKDNNSLHATQEFYDKVREYYDSHLHKHKSDVKPWHYKLSYIMFGPCQIAMFTGFIVGFISTIRTWVFNKTGAQFIFYETINSIGNSHLVVNYLIIGANFHFIKKYEYSFSFRKIDHVFLLVFKCIFLPFLGLLYLYIAKEVGDSIKPSLFNAYLQWVMPTSIDIITMVQAKEINVRDACINTALQWGWYSVVNTFAAFSPSLKIIGF